jgi:hypothetical protein
MSVFERVYGVSADFDDWDHPVASLSRRHMARFMRHSQPLVAAFVHCCFWVRENPEMVDIPPPFVFESDEYSAELVEVSD